MLVKTLLPFIVAALAVNAAPVADAKMTPSKGHGRAPASPPTLPVTPPVGPRAEVHKPRPGKKAEGSESPLPVDPASKLAAAKSNVPRDEDNEDYEESEAEAAKPKPKPKHKDATSPVDMLPAPAKQVAKMAPRAEDRVAELKESQPDFRPTTHMTDAKSKKLSETAGTMKVYNVGHEKGTDAVQPLGVHIRGMDKPQPPSPVNAFPKVVPRASKPAKKPVNQEAAMPQVPPAQVMDAKDTVLSHAPRAHNKSHKQTPLSAASTVKDTVAEKPKMVTGSKM